MRHYWANADTLILDIEIFETLQVSSGKEDYAFERAIAFNLTDKKPVMLLKDNRSWVDTNNLVAIDPDDPDKVMFSVVSEVHDKEPGRVRTKNADRFAYYVMKTDLKKGTSRQVDSDGRFVVDAVHAADGKMVAELRYKDIGRGLHSVSITKGNQVLFQRDDVSFNPVSLWGLDTSGNNLIIFLQEGEPYGLHRLSLADGSLAAMETGSAGGTVSPVVDARSLRVVGFEYSGETTEQVFEDPALQSQLAAVRSAMPGASVTLESWTDDRSESVIRVDFPGKPVAYYTFQPGIGALSPLGNKAPHLDDRPLGTIEHISYAARDGLTIPGYLTLPPGKTRDDGPFPLVLLPHGGPEAHDTSTFDWWAQGLAAAGYAVIQPNFRGSTGYGTGFRDAGFGEYGDKMVTDVLDAETWAQAQGLAEAGRTCVVGASYGGYSALMAALHDSAAVQCVVAVNPVTSPFGLLADYRYGSFAVNGMERFLGSGRFDSPAARSSITPVQRVAELKAPVLLIASEEDSTVPIEQSEQLERAAKGVADVTMVRIAGEDHYLRSTRARYDVLSDTLEFLHSHVPAN
ncbi:alpha/beta hydrolase family protein [Hyphomonas johnsonii]|nr:alpha/beta fold hydrolase [Hyphomonas johnsonii]